MNFLHKSRVRHASIYISRSSLVQSMFLKPLLYVAESVLSSKRKKNNFWKKFSKLPHYSLVKWLFCYREVKIGVINVLLIVDNFFPLIPRNFLRTMLVCRHHHMFLTQCIIYNLRMCHGRDFGMSHRLKCPYMQQIPFVWKNFE